MDEEAAVRHEILLDELRGSMCQRRAKSISPQSATSTFALQAHRQEQWHGEEATAEEDEESCMEEVALADIADVDAQEEHAEEPVSDATMQSNQIQASRFEIDVREDAHLSDDEPSYKKRRRRRIYCCPWCSFLLSMHRLPGVMGA